MNQKPGALHVIFGGTFDPIHLGHLHIAEQVRQCLAINEIRFIPCNQSPTRTRPIASAEHRLAMIEIAIANKPNFTVDDREIRRGGVSYTIDTLRELKSENKNWALLLGADAFASFMQWREWEEVSKLCQLIIINRPNCDIKNLHTTFSKNNILMTVPPNPISSSLVRERMKANKDVKELLPNGVFEYIVKHRLYKEISA